ncbi:MAG: heavy metal sensor histidine kinase [Burkholderiaceae bacterium]
MMVSLRWARDSLAGRMSLYFGVGTLLILGLLGTVLFVLVERQVKIRDANELIAKTVAVQALLEKINARSDVDHFVTLIRATEVGHQDLDIGILINEEWALMPEPQLIDHMLEHTVSPETQIGHPMISVINDRQWTMHHFAHEMNAQPGTVLQAIVAIDVTDTSELITRLRNALAGLGLAGAAMIAALTWVATVRALAPLKRIAHEAEQMTAQALGQPLSIADAPVEVRGLVTSINQMLSRLQKSFSSLEQFSADIAHELRTPVNALLTQTQVMLSRDRAIEEYRETLHQSLEELNRLQRMVSDMLFIARADRTVITTPFESINLRKMALEVVEYVELIASENNQIIEIEGDVSAPGDTLMLRRAMTNLLTNAVHYSTANARILLVLGEDQEHAIIRVTNPYSQQMDPTQIERLFDRFSRHSPEQAGQNAGLGLGLSIVQSIMRVHEGQVTAGTEASQFWVQLQWPLVPSAVAKHGAFD